MVQATMQNRFGQTLFDVSGVAAERAKLLQQLAWGMGIAEVVGGLIIIGLHVFGIFKGTLLVPAVSGTILVGIAITAATVWFTTHKKQQHAYRLFLYGSIVYFSLIVYVLGGVGGPMFLAYLLPITAAGLFGKPIDSMRLFFLAIVMYTTLTLFEFAGWLTPVVVLNETGHAILSFLVFTAIGSLLACLAMLWSASTSMFLSYQREQADAIFNSNQKLIDKNIQQVELGSELSTAAAQLLAASHQQASGATEQASAVSQVSTTIEELGSTARQIAISSEQVADASRQTLENLSDGQDAVDRSIQAMERIRSRVQDVSTRVLNLGERSQQIGEIIDLINDLSDETHLRALNAAIEAAGAGEHGRRFAVVAAEVKSLANRALTAAKEVKGVIVEIQQATNAAVLAAEEGGKEVEYGVELAHSAGLVMDNIVLVAERTAQSSAEISLATSQQQSASEQVVETMREIAEVARQSAAGSRQISESAQILTAIAQRLHGIVYDPPTLDARGAPYDDLDLRMRQIRSNGLDEHVTKSKNNGA